jgi:hypothetical protein
MDQTTLQRFLIDAQAVADHLLQLAAADDQAAAARLANEFEAGRASLSLAFTVGRDAQMVELLVREAGRTTPIAMLPLRMVAGVRV